MADSLSTKELDKFYTKDSVLKFGNLDDARGLDAITKFFEVQFPMLYSMQHEILSVRRF